MFLNGLNQLTATTPGAGQASVPTLSYDSKGNTTAIGTSAYSYNSENFLKTGPASTALLYDPLGRLHEVNKGTAATTTRFLYDGVDMIAEYSGTNAIARRYVHGPGTDEPFLAYEGSTLATKRYLTADERGSIVAVTDGTGTVQTKRIP
jgi:hypothetical protein